VRVRWLFAFTACAMGGLANQQMGDIIVIGARPQQPLELHRGIWRDVSRCLGPLAKPLSVPLGTARMLISEHGYLSYGMTVFEAGEPAGIIIDERYWLHPTVFSHEAIHVIAREQGHDRRVFRCEMRLPTGDLGMRPVSPDSMAHYRRLATGG